MGTFEVAVSYGAKQIAIYEMLKVKICFKVYKELYDKIDSCAVYFNFAKYNMTKEKADFTELGDREYEISLDVFLYGSTDYWLLKVIKVEFHGTLKTKDDQDLKLSMTFPEANIANMDHPEVKLLTPKQDIDFKIDHSPPALQNEFYAVSLTFKRQPTGNEISDLELYMQTIT